MTDIEKFKALLEYFVAHLEYLQYRDKKYQLQRGRGYAQYIEPLIQSHRFKETGQGYNGDAIQNQISCWEQYSCKNKTSGKIFINVQIHFGRKTTAANYLCWDGTYNNVLAKWKGVQKVIMELSIEDKSSNKRQKAASMTKTIMQLGLFDGNPPNNDLKDFWNCYSQFA